MLSTTGALRSLSKLNLATSKAIARGRPTIRVVDDDDDGTTQITMVASLPFSFPLALASFLALHGLRKRSLSPSGAAAAFIVGYTMVSVPLLAFGVSLVVFYLTGSRATKVGKALKHKLEEGHQDAGYRNAAQVLCNSLSAAIAALLWSALYEPGSYAAKLLDFSGVHVGPKVSYDLEQWCPLTPPPSASLSRPLIYVTLG